MASRIKKVEWIGLYTLTGLIDLVQLFGDLFFTELAGTPEAINEIADPIIGVTLAAYFQLRGVSMLKHPKRIASLLGVTGLEELTGAAAPAWIVDIWYIQRTVKQEEAQSQANQFQVQQYALNQKGVRPPENARQAPLNTKENGISMRRPS